MGFTAESIMLDVWCRVTLADFCICSKHNPSVALNRDLDLTWFLCALSLTLNPLCLFPLSESSIRPDVGLKPVEALSSVRLVDLLKTSALSKDSGFDLERRRSKRSVFLHSGVRICPQETLNEILASHRAYYQLRGTPSYIYWLHQYFPLHFHSKKTNIIKLHCSGEQISFNGLISSFAVGRCPILLVR